MKKTLFFILLLLLLVLTLGSCSDKLGDGADESVQSFSTDMTIAIEETAIKNRDSELLYDNVFKADTEMQMIFWEFVENNPIDNDYHSEECDSSTLALRKHQKKYIDIWLEELKFSCESFASLLSESEKSLFIEYEEQWEKQLTNEFQLISDIFNNPEHEVHPGSVFPLESDVEYLQRIRERTLYVKYLQYYMESCDETDGEVKVVFKYVSSER